MRSITFQIDAEGIAKHEVHGMAGESCKEFSAGLEKYFGQGESEEKPEYFDPTEKERGFQAGG